MDNWRLLKKVCKQGWGNHKESKCTGAITDRVLLSTSWITSIIEELRIKTIVDVGCGDLFTLKEADLIDAHYYGCDWIEQETLSENLAQLKTTGIKSFEIKDISVDDLPSADLMICRSVLIHMTNDMAVSTLKNILRSKPKYFLASTHDIKDNHSRHNVIKYPAFSRMNLELAPFNFSTPISSHKSYELTQTKIKSGEAVWCADDILINLSVL